LDQLAGPADGVVELLLDLAWSGDRRFDLADPVQPYLYQMTVLTYAVSREHYTGWLNASLLCGDWSMLRFPRALRKTWQARVDGLRVVTVTVQHDPVEVVEVRHVDPPVRAEHPGLSGAGLRSE
jgi:hypothetical protein